MVFAIILGLRDPFGGWRGTVADDEHHRVCMARAAGTAGFSTSDPRGKGDAQDGLIRTYLHIYHQYACLIKFMTENQFPSWR
jgi:hypothetical protein